MKLIKTLFWIAAIYGFAVLVPGFFTEARFNASSPPAITHPEFYYGFYGLALVFQLVFILIARDPVKYHALIPIAILEKAAFFIPSMILWSQGRLAASGPFYGAMIDGVFMLLFALAWIFGRAKR